MNEHIYGDVTSNSVLYVEQHRSNKIVERIPQSSVQLNWTHHCFDVYAPALSIWNSVYETITIYVIAIDIIAPNTERITGIIISTVVSKTVCNWYENLIIA